MSTEIKLTKASVSDAEEILHIQELAFQSEAELYNNFSIPPLIQSLDSVIADLHEYDYYKAVQEDRMVGSIKVKLPEKYRLWIGRLVVVPDSQNRGIGKFIMSEIENLYPHVRVFELFTGEKSKRNIAFYKTLGYDIKEYFHDPDHADILLVKMGKYREK